MLRLRFTPASILLPALIPLLAAAQGPLAVHPPPVDSSAAGQNLADSLRLRLQDALNAAKNHDAPRLRSLIAQWELPDYRDWFVKTFGTETGQRIAEQYAVNFADGDTYLKTFFTEITGQDGEWMIFKSDPNASASEAGEDPPPKRGWQRPNEVFIVYWRNRESSGSPRLHPVGTFAFLNGSFRIIGVARLPASTPGMSSYPPLGPMDPSGKSIGAANAPFDAGSSPHAGHIPVRAATYPTCIYCPDPDLPKSVRKKGIEGTVVLQVIVRPDGSASDIKIVKSLDPEHDQAAIDAVAKWRFKPGLDRNGEPVAAIVPIEMTFRQLR